MLVEPPAGPLHLINTHLGLDRRERAMQIQHLLGNDWLASLARDEPVIFCGDLNFTPRSPLYRQVSARLTDAQNPSRASTNRRTFPAVHPISRLDYVFVSEPLQVEDVHVPRNHLTRVASDHLPVIVDLMLKES